MMVSVWVRFLFALRDGHLVKIRTQNEFRFGGLLIALAIEIWLMNNDETAVRVTNDVAYYCRWCLRKRFSFLEDLGEII